MAISSRGLRYWAEMGKGCHPKMKKSHDNRSPLGKWIDRKRLAVDSGVVVLALLVMITISMLGFRFMRNSHATAQASGIVSEAEERHGIVGFARIVDGDTLEVAGTKIRLFGIDAPEDGQLCRDGSERDYDCGAISTARLTAIISGQIVSCQPRTTDRYGRTVAVCSVLGHDIGREIVSLGWAVAFERYSHDYIGDETHAHEQRLGLWQGNFVRPSEYRARKHESR